MASLTDTPRSRFQRTPVSNSLKNACVTSTISNTSATPKNPAKLLNPFSGESTGARQNFPDFSPSVFTHKDTPAGARSGKKFQWSIDEMAHLQPADIDEHTAQAFHCTPKRDTAKQLALDKFFLQQNVVASPLVSSMSTGKKTAIKHVTFSPLPPATKYINREEESSGDSSSESAMDIMEEGSRHSVCTQPSGTQMEMDESLPPNCAQMESMAEFKDMSFASLRRKLFGPCDRGNSPSSSREPSPSLDRGDYVYQQTHSRLGDKEEPAITPGQFLCMGSEDDNSDYDLHGVRSRRSWGRCSSSPTSHLGEEMDGLRSSPIGLMDEEIVFPPVALCQSPEPEDFGQMESLDLSPISSRSLQQSSVVADKENEFCPRPLASTLRNGLYCPYPGKESEMSMTGSFGDFSDGDEMVRAEKLHTPMTPLMDRTNQPSTLRMSQLDTVTTPSQFSCSLTEDMPMSHGKHFSLSQVTPSSSLERPIGSETPQRLAMLAKGCVPMDGGSTGEFPIATNQALRDKGYRSWPSQGSTPLSRQQQSASYDDWQRSVNSWQDSIRDQLAEFDRTKGTH